MKKGDKFPVSIAGQEVAQAEVKEVNEEEKLVTLIVPGTIATMSYRTHDELTPGDPAQEAPEAEGTEHILLTDHVVKPDNHDGIKTVAESPEPTQTQGQPVASPPPSQVETVPTETQAPVVPTEVEEAVEREATGSEEPL